MNECQYAVILVYSTSHAIRIERLLNRAHIECKLIPVPRQLSSDCGVCVRLNLNDREKAIQCINNSQIEIQGIFNI
ncbi:DUF3343 domain-containing protein [candidate division KSB1 bacterium]|nr:DUF3343 domain-containing protein [candidate division KSB1 bacterium]